MLLSLDRDLKILQLTIEFIMALFKALAGIIVI